MRRGLDSWRCLFHNKWHDSTVDPWVCVRERGKAILAGEYTCQGECVDVSTAGMPEGAVWVVACESCGGSYWEDRDIW